MSEISEEPVSPRMTTEHVLEDTAKPENRNQFRPRFRWKAGLIALATILTLTSSWNHWSQSVPQLILTVDAGAKMSTEENDQADIYVDRGDGNGLTIVPSRLNYYHSQQTPTRMIFELGDLDNISFTRFDPILLTGNEPFRVHIKKLEFKIAAYTRPLTLPPSSLVPIKDVQKTVDSEGDGMWLNIEAHTLDPQMQLILPISILDQVPIIKKQSFFIILGFGFATLLLSLVLVILLQSVLKITDQQTNVSSNLGAWK